jgi:poly(3-hydroxybutyrate) depolymerase
MPTLDTGLACDTFGTPFIHACDYDAAGLLLAALYGKLEPRTEATGELRTVDQPGGPGAEMLETGYLYVPAACTAGESCGVHVALHGCAQSRAFVDDAFARGAGYNEWAESNRLLVLYPQADASQVAPTNPYGCWDWWGYTSGDYATQGGAQVRVIKAMIDRLAGRKL